MWITTPLHRTAPPIMKTSQIFSITAGTLLAAGVGYALYFDRKRQSDPAFRKQLKRDAKKSRKLEKRQADAHKRDVESTIKEIVAEARQPGVLPTSPQEMEKYFMTCITKGETLLAAGPAAYLPAAASFFHAIKVYPDPMGLIQILQQATPQPCLDLIIEMIGQDSEMSRAEGSSRPQGGAGGPGANPLAQLAELAGQAPNSSGSSSSANTGDVDDVDATASTPAQKDSSPTTSGPPSQASSQEWENLSGTSVGSSAAGSEQTQTATGAADEEKNSSHGGSSGAFDFSSSSGSFAPSPLFEGNSNPLAATEAAAAGAAEGEPEPETKADVDAEAEQQDKVESEAGA